MNYDDFLEKLKEEIQNNMSGQVTFSMYTTRKANETLEGLTIRTGNERIAPVIYPEKLYRDFINGRSIENIAEEMCSTIQRNHPAIPELTAENARKSISFSLLNREMNKDLLSRCPYKKVHDLIAVPRWHINSEASFLVDNNVMQQLRMTKEEVLRIAQANTESAAYTCRSMNDVMKEMMVNDGVPEEVIAEMIPGEAPFYVMTNPEGIDGSCCMLSDSFLQGVCGDIDVGSIYILPSSRHEVLAVHPDLVTVPSDLKQMVMEVNATEVSATDFLSDEIYKYDGLTHSLSVCDENGLFRDVDDKESIIKEFSMSKGR